MNVDRGLGLARVFTNRAAPVASAGFWLVVAACSSPKERATSGSDTPLEARVCSESHNSYECARAIEQYWLHRKPAYVSRRGDTLEIRLKNGTTAVFIDERDGNGEEAASYRYRERLDPLGHFVIAEQWYEGGGYVLVDEETGQRQFVYGLPVISPDRTRLAVASLDLVAGYVPNLMQIFAAGPEGLALEWQLVAADAGGTAAWGPAEVEWLDSRTVRFLQVADTPCVPDTDACDKPVVVQLSEDGWRTVAEHPHRP